MAFKGESVIEEEEEKEDDEGEDDEAKEKKFRKMVFLANKRRKLKLQLELNRKKNQMEISKSKKEEIISKHEKTFNQGKRHFYNAYAQIKSIMFTLIVTKLFLTPACVTTVLFTPLQKMASLGE